MTARISRDASGKLTKPPNLFYEKTLRTHFKKSQIVDKPSKPYFPKRDYEGLKYFPDS
jgi:hypothetical protein